jgi:4-aminobutyrate aminotransferase-like enzyme
VSAAIGQAVLDVIDDEGLMERARRAGELFFAEMAPLVERHPIIGDVRGRGLYLGVDLVRDRETREPAGDAARYVALRMRQRGVLIGTDGPQGNVLKIKPPITFTDDEVRRLVATLDEILSETPVASPDRGH